MRGRIKKMRSKRWKLENEGSGKWEEGSGKWEVRDESWKMKDQENAKKDQENEKKDQENEKKDQENERKDQENEVEKFSDVRIIFKKVKKRQSQRWRYIRIKYKVGGKHYKIV